VYLSALIHRNRLFDIACRWLAGEVRPNDGRIVTEIFIFERIITAPIVRALIADLLDGRPHGTCWMQRVVTKDAVRQAIADGAAGSNGRVRDLVEHYRTRSEEYFPRTPVNMTLVTGDTGTLVAMIRRKRLQRIAEKVSRRIAKELAGTIEDSARSFARRRAQAAGIPLDDLLSTAEVMTDEFEAAERDVADRVRSGEIRFETDPLTVDDVIGVKLIGSPPELDRLERRLTEREGIRVRSREVHEGSYTGTHLLVEIDLPPVGTIADRVRSVDWSFAAGRGLSPNALETDFFEYLESGSRSFTIELILTTFSDLVESEFGRCIHEARILDQRGSIRYSGRIAENASHIIEFLLEVAISPTVVVDELPVRIGGRYLRDTLTHALSHLWNNDRPEWLLPPTPAGRQPLAPAHPPRP
jgi:hypothetical protein